MMGTKERAFGPLCHRSLETLVPADHFYRHLDAKLDLSFVRDLVRDKYAPQGRPSIDPIVFFKLQLVMFFEGLRSERELCGWPPTGSARAGISATTSMRSCPITPV